MSPKIKIIHGKNYSQIRWNSKMFFFNWDFNPYLRGKRISAELTHIHPLDSRHAELEGWGAERSWHRMAYLSGETRELLSPKLGEFMRPRGRVWLIYPYIFRYVNKMPSFFLYPTYSCARSSVYYAHPCFDDLRRRRGKSSLAAERGGGVPAYRDARDICWMVHLQEKKLTMRRGEIRWIFIRVCLGLYMRVFKARGTREKQFFSHNFCLLKGGNYLS